MSRKRNFFGNLKNSIPLYQSKIKQKTYAKLSSIVISKNWKSFEQDMSESYFLQNHDVLGMFCPAGCLFYFEHFLTGK